MAISSISGLTQSTQPNYATKAPDELDQMDFMMLLVKQLENQDPLNPQDGTEFAAQLAQFTSLEQMIQINNGVQDMSLYQLSLNNMASASLIGKNVTVEDSTLVVHEGTPSRIQYDLAADADDVTVAIYDADGTQVYSESLGRMADGTHSFEWNGLTEYGDHAEDGQYTFQIVATDANDELIDVNTLNTHKVTGVQFQSGITYLVVEGGALISLGDVMSIEAPVESVVADPDSNSGV